MQETIDLIKRFEGFRSKSYFATDHERKKNILTIGYGATSINNKKILPNQTITENQAEDLLKLEVTKLSDIIKRELPLLNEYQIGAITSLSYNVGITAVLNSTMVKRLKAKDNIDIDINDFQRLRKDILVFSQRKDYKHTLEYSEFHRWIYQSGKALFGLFVRREAEHQLFNKVI